MTNWQGPTHERVIKHVLTAAMRGSRPLTSGLKVQKADRTQISMKLPFEGTIGENIHKVRDSNAVSLPLDSNKKKTSIGNYKMPLFPVFSF